MQVSETIVDFAQLTGPPREALLREMLALDAAVFAGAKPADLLPFLEDPRAEAVPVVLYRSGGRLVGQNIIPILRLGVDGREVAVFTAVAGLLPEVRGGYRTQRSATRVALRYRLENPRTPAYLVMGLLQPKVYAQFAGFITRFYPRPEVATPREMEAVIAALARNDPSFQRRDDHWVQTGLPMPIDTANEREALDGSSPLQAFYRRCMRDEAVGEALVGICRVDLPTLAECGVRQAWHRLKRRWR